MRRCVKCGGTGHLLIECPEFRAELAQPSAGVCGRCDGEATFRPTVVSRDPYRVEAMLVCPCCSFAGCRHRCPYIDAEGIQCRARYGHAALRSLPDGMSHDCRRLDNIRVGQYSGRVVPKRTRHGVTP